MSDFDNISSLAEYDELERKKARNNFLHILYTIMVFVFIILVGILMYVIISMVIDDNSKETKLDLNSNDVRVLYSYVTYGTRGIRNDKFINNSYVDINSFSNDEKFMYALQFSQDADLVYTNKNNSYGRRVYALSDEKIREYMVTFFGPNITYNNDININYVYPFRKNGFNYAQTSYSTRIGAYEVIFSNYLNDEVKPNLDNYYTQLYDAALLDDGRIVLREKIVYLEVSNVGSNYNVSLYRDAKHTKLISELNNLSKDDIDNGVIDFNTILNPTYIEYYFGLNGIKYYFESSRIVGE